MLSPTAFHNFP